MEYIMGCRHYEDEPEQQVRVLDTQLAAAIKIANEVTELLCSTCKHLIQTKQVSAFSDVPKLSTWYEHHLAKDRARAISKHLAAYPQFSKTEIIKMMDNGILSSD